MASLNQTINQLFQNGKYNQALKLLKKNEKKTPNDAEIQRLLGITYIHLKKFILALKHLTKALSIKPNAPEILLNIASLHKEQNNFELAIFSIDKVLNTDSNHLVARFNLGNIYRLMENWEQASFNYEKVLHLDANHLPSIITMGLMKKNAGKIDEAIAFFHRALNIDPLNKSVYLALANLKNYQFSEDEFNMITQIINQSTDDESIELLFAKAQNLEHKEQYKEAFHYLERANNAQHKKIKRKPYNWPDYSKKITTVFNSLPNNSTYLKMKDQQPNPLFIVSMPRSGSTLVEQILASHPAVFGASEIPTFPKIINQSEQLSQKKFPEFWAQINEPELKQMALNYQEKINTYGLDYKFVSDKNLLNFNYIGAIMSAMPNSLFIHCTRHPMDVCLSCYKQLFSMGQEYSYNLDELAAYYNHHETIMKFWKKRYPKNIFTINYEDLVKDTKQQIMGVLDFLKLPWDDNCLEFHKTKRVIKTASAAQVTHKIYTNSSHKFEKYGNLLKKLETNLNMT